MNEQLQEFLKECIDRGYDYKSLSIMFHDLEFTNEGIHNIYEEQTYISYHELFSKESGIMEFVNWKEKELRTKYRPFISGHVFGILGTPFEFWAMAKGGSVDCDTNFTGTIVEYHYMIMGPMSASEKKKYFLENALLPN